MFYQQQKPEGQYRNDETVVDISDKWVQKKRISPPNTFSLAHSSSNGSLNPGPQIRFVQQKKEWV